MSNCEYDPNYLAQLRDFARDTVRAAAVRIRAQRAEIIGSDGLEAHTQTKSSAVDPVTEVDQSTERFIAESIQSQRPGDGIFGEDRGFRCLGNWSHMDCGPHRWHGEFPLRH